jgi:hypothetical protein
MAVRRDEPGAADERRSTQMKTIALSAFICVHLRPKIVVQQVPNRLRTEASVWPIRRRNRLRHQWWGRHSACRGVLAGVKRRSTQWQ